MSRTSSYQTPSEWTNRRSECFNQLPKNHDPKFNSRILLTVMCHFMSNLVLSGLWLGLVFGMWLNWGGEYRGFSPTKDYSCRQVNYFGSAMNLTQVEGDLKRVFWKKNDNHHVPASDNLQVTESGVYAVSSAIGFYCNSSFSDYKFEQVLDSSRGRGVKDRMDLFGVSPEIPGVCHRSYLYSVFDLEKGDYIYVNVKTPLSIDYKVSYLSYYRIRDPLRCPRKIKILAKGKNETVRTSRAFLGQKVFKDTRYWWSDAFFLKRSCDVGDCKDVFLERE